VEPAAVLGKLILVIGNERSDLCEGIQQELVVWEFTVGEVDIRHFVGMVVAEVAIQHNRANLHLLGIILEIGLMGNQPGALRAPVVICNHSDVFVNSDMLP
jgi:hypothetical protein